MFSAERKTTHPAGRAGGYDCSPADGFWGGFAPRLWVWFHMPFKAQYRLIFRRLRAFCTPTHTFSPDTFTRRFRCGFCCHFGTTKARPALLLSLPVGAE